jgi:uncharacterized protein
MSENKLHLEKSAYLLQHAKNPIHWWAYGPEALEFAQKNNLPLFLSIGYSTCHWCHVMAHESFEDNATAKILNDQYVCIKIDREEHPHLDQLYQSVAAAATGRGGWPLNVFLTPKLNPIFVGTYFPKIARDGMPSFEEVLSHLKHVYTENRDKVEEQGAELLAEIAKAPKLERKVEFQGHFPSPLAIMNALANYADKENGGYGQAPKFPHFAFLEWASEQILENMIPQEQGQHIVDTVEKMMMGGLFDHLKGGIHRYSTDAKWLVPHFEKMGYDQAGLLKVLAKMTPFYPSPQLYDGILQTLDYLQSEMVSDEEYFMAAQDADSEGQEGLYFTFTKEEFVQALKDNEEELGAFQEEWVKWFRVSEKGNFEQDLNVISLDPQFKNDYLSAENWETIRKIRHTLLNERKQRIPPATDRKGVASWNFMLLSALCDVIQYSRVPVITQEALKLLHLVIEGVSKTFIGVDAKGRHILKHTTSTDKTPLYLEDYAQFAECQLRLYEVTSTEVFLTNAIETVTFLIKEFFNEKEASAISISQAGFQRAPLNDQSYRSSLATFIVTMNRLSLLIPELDPKKFWGEKWEDMLQLALANPVGHGEALRAFTYPLDIYRKVEVPRDWVNEEEFQRLRSHFLGRFVLAYHDRNDDQWQVCNRNTCEKEGKGLEDLLETFSNSEAEVQ